MKHLYLDIKLFIYLSSVIVLFIIGFFIPQLFIVAQFALVLVVGITVFEIFVLFRTKIGIECKRDIPDVLTLNDDNSVQLHAQSYFPFPIKLEIIDELPVQAQARDFKIELSIGIQESFSTHYNLLPSKRGVYNFGKVHFFVSAFLGLVQRRVICDCTVSSSVYPSIHQMKKQEFQFFSSRKAAQDVKKVRRLGNNREFEQIKNYVVGDDFRTINWKATSRRRQLMVNQYQDERDQQIYCILDKGRALEMTFNEMTLLDHSINSILAISNIALKKGDKAGLFTFSDKLGDLLKAERSVGQINRISEILHKQKTNFLESNFELLYYGIREKIKGRSLLILYSNFDTIQAVHRVLPMLRRINKMHMLVVIFFENTELVEFTSKDYDSVEDVYFRTIAKKFSQEKQYIAKELNLHGIQTLLTSPKKLSVDTINKYLELKSRGMI